MQTKITTKLKKFISTLVCVMMVAGTFPAFALNSSVFAGNGVAYSTQTGAVPEISEDIEAKNAESDELNGGQAVETADNVQDVQMEGGNGKVLEASGPEDFKNKVNSAEDGDTIKLTGNIEVNNAEGYALTVSGKKITITGGKITYKGKGRLLKIKGENSGVTLEGVEIAGFGNAESLYKSLIKLEGGFLTLGQGAQILNCASRLGGGAIYCFKGKVNINGGKIFNCKTDDGGGAIFC